MSITDDPKDPRIKRGPPDRVPVPMAGAYLVLSAAERARGFVRPVRRSYVHVGRKVCGKIRAFENELRLWVCVEEVDHEGECSSWSQAGNIEEAIRIERTHRMGGCGTVTKMGQELAETYARDIHFYGATYCCGCRMHRRVGEYGEFVWDGTDIRVGT